MSKDDGGPAFPVLDDSGGVLVLRHPGMTLRDYFAAKAVTGLLGRAWADADGNAPPNVFELWAIAAYKTADAMIAERAK